MSRVRNVINFLFEHFNIQSRKFVVEEVISFIVTLKFKMVAAAILEYSAT